LRNVFVKIAITQSCEAHTSGLSWGRPRN